MNVIEVNHLTKDYGSGRGVFDVDLRVEKGEVFGFLGPNGAGKSTTIRHLMGFSRPDQGETKIFGKPTFVRYHEILSEVGYIPGEIALPAGLTGWGFIDMMRELKKRPKKDRLDEMLRLFELDDAVLKGETKRMSLGVKRKLAVVTAFMSDPEVARLAKERQTTRAWVSMEEAARLPGRWVFAIGNAPTALIRLHELILEKKVDPVLVIGVPVGFVNVVESKERIWEVCLAHQVPVIAAMGRKGGSGVAAAICNALLYTATGRTV